MSATYRNNSDSLDFTGETSIPVRAPRTADLVSDWLRARILSGEFESGSLLPPERKTAAFLGVNRHTLRTGLLRLESEGLIRIRQGEGARVTDFRQSGGLELIRHFPREKQNALFPGFLELRRAIAVEALGLFCERATEEPLERLEQLAALQLAEQDRTAFIQRDLEFARELIRAAGNLPMELLYNTVIGFYSARPDLAELMFADLEGHRHSYGLAVALVRKGDPSTVREAVRAALAAVDRQIIARFNETLSPEEPLSGTDIGGQP